jgi:hypothetical protein
VPSVLVLLPVPSGVPWEWELLPVTVLVLV